MKRFLSLTSTAATAFALVTGASTASALPLLSESAALKYTKALTLYPDHLDRNKFYFMPNSSQISRDARNVPTFSFTYYGLNDPNATDAGAFMVYVGRLASDPDQQIALAQFLRSNPHAGVAVLALKESTIGLKTTAADMPLKAFFSEFNFSAKGGRAEDEIGINAVLTKAGAGVLKPIYLARQARR